MFKKSDPLLLVLLGISLLGNVYLFKRVGPMPTAAPTLLHVGDAVPALTGTTVTGDAAHVDFRSKPAVIYFFSPSCGWCERNLDNVQALAHRTADSYDFVAVAVDDRNLESYITDRHITWRVLKDVPRSLQDRYRVLGTPATVVVALGGKVTNSWSGAFIGNNGQEVERVFRLKLPGLRDAGPPPHS